MSAEERGPDAGPEIGPVPALDQPTRARKLRDASLLLPFAGLVLLMPPVADVFAVEAEIGGVPVVLAYVFAVWLALIVLAARIARRLG